MFRQGNVSFVILLLSCALVATDNNVHECSLRCAPSKSPTGETLTKCQVTHPKKMRCSPGQKMFLQLQNVSFLDLSNNKFTNVPSEMFPYCKSLRYLSLANNSLRTVKFGAFRDLKKLTTLDISYNNVREWNVDFENELLSLSGLFVEGNNYDWLLSSYLLKLKNLIGVQGVQFNKYCTYCNLVKLSFYGAEIISEYKRRCEYSKSLSSPGGWPWNDDIEYGETFDVVKAGFWPTCLCQDLCYVHQAKFPYSKAFGRNIIAAQKVLYFTGPFALLINAAIIILVAFSGALRSDTAVFLICNLAFCDSLVGVVSTIFARFNIFKMRNDFLYKILEGKYETKDDSVELKIAWSYIMGPILTFSVALQVCISFIMTLDKFFKIVFAMKPHIALTRRSIFLSICLSWLFSITFAVLPVFNVGRMSYIKLNMIIPLPTDQGDQLDLKLGIAAGTQIFLMVIQFVSLVLYIPIFVVAKKSGGNVGIRNEARIARKIFPLVFSNVAFFTIPTMFSIFVHGVNNKIDYHSMSLAMAQGVSFLLVNIPVFCVSMNSILNPFLYPMRHPKVKRELNAKTIGVRTVLNGWFAFLRQHFNLSSNAVVGPAEEIEMQDGSVNTGTFALKSTSQ